MPFHLFRSNLVRLEKSLAFYEIGKELPGKTFKRILLEIEGEIEKIESILKSSDGEENLKEFLLTLPNTNVLVGAVDEVGKEIVKLKENLELLLKEDYDNSLMSRGRVKYGNINMLKTRVKRVHELLGMITGHEIYETLVEKIKMLNDLEKTMKDLKRAA